MANYLFDQAKTKDDLADFFINEKADLGSFGSTVNQTFEAFVLAKVIEWFNGEGFKTQIVNPKIDGKEIFRLKFSTRGAPKNYTYAFVRKGKEEYQIRHQLRVATARERKRRTNNANIVCDIAIIQNNDLSQFKTDNGVPNDWLVSFGEVKHMSAFAELIASFIGLTFELKPDRLKRIRTGSHHSKILPCFLYVSGYLNPTAKGIIETIKNRRFDIDIYSFENKM